MIENHWKNTMLRIMHVDADLETWEREDDYFWKEKDYEGKESKASNFIISFLKEKIGIR